MGNGSPWRAESKQQGASWQTAAVVVLAAALAPAGLTLRVPRALPCHQRPACEQPRACLCMCHTLCVSLLHVCWGTLSLPTYHLICKKPTTRCQGGFISFFFKDDKCTDINIFLVPTIRLFSKTKRGRSWLFLRPHWFYLSLAFQTSSVPWSGVVVQTHPVL